MFINLKNFVIFIKTHFFIGFLNIIMSPTFISSFSSRIFSKRSISSVISYDLLNFSKRSISSVMSSDLLSFSKSDLSIYI